MVCVPKEVDTELYKNLKSYEKQIDVVPLYDIVYEKNKDIKVNDEDYVVFSSASSVKGFVNSIDDLDYNSINSICIGKKTAEEASSYGMKVSVSKEATIESLVECVIECSKRGID